MNNSIRMTDDYVMWEYNLVTYRMILSGYENKILEQIESNDFWTQEYDILKIEITNVWITIIDSNSKCRITLTKDDFINFLKMDEPISVRDNIDDEDTESGIQFDKKYLEIYSNKQRVTSVLQNK